MTRRAVQEIFSKDLITDGDRRTLELWGGTMTFAEETDVIARLEYGLTHPIRIMKAAWRGRITYRRPASMVRKFEKAYNVFFVRSGKISFHDASSSASIGGDVIGIQLPTRAYRAEFWPDETGWVQVMHVRIPPHRIAIGALPHSAFFLASARSPSGDAARRVAELIFDTERLVPLRSLERMVDLLTGLIEDCALQKPRWERGSEYTRSKFQKIIAFIDDNIADPELSARSAADSLRISTRYISKIMRDHATSFPACVRERRVAHARKLLVEQRDHELSISEVAGFSGFRAVPQFNRTFRNVTGSTPGAFRRAERGKSDRKAL